jgi:hypothetical protein
VTALEPRLTSLDERVLAQLPAERPGLRVGAIARALVPRPSWGRDPGVTPELARDVRLILRGFEHLGRARQRSGWWTKA